MKDAHVLAIVQNHWCGVRDDVTVGIRRNVRPRLAVDLTVR